jgi:hypothetical protein
MRGTNLTWTIIVVTVLLLLATWLGFLFREVPRDVVMGMWLRRSAVRLDHDEP